MLSPGVAGAEAQGISTTRRDSDDLPAFTRQQFIDVQRQINAVEGRIQQEVLRFGLDLIPEKLLTIQGSSIALNVLVMNLEMLP